MLWRGFIVERDEAKEFLSGREREKDTGLDGLSGYLLLRNILSGTTSRAEAPGRSAALFQ